MMNTECAEAASTSRAEIDVPEDPHETLLAALAIIRQKGASDAPICFVMDIFEFVNNWYNTFGPQSLLKNEVRYWLELDEETFNLYWKAPELITSIEPLRRRLHTQGDAPTKALWPHVLRVSRILHKVGSIGHSHLLTWQGGRASAWHVGKALDLLRREGLIETFDKPGRRRPIRWHRLLVPRVIAGTSGTSDSPPMPLET